MTVSLSLLKMQLNIDHDGDDVLLQHKLDAAECWVDNYIGSYSTGLSAACDEAILQLAAYWYEHREAATLGDAATPIPFGIRELIRPYCLW